MNFTADEISDFKDNWGQTHDDVCLELSFHKDGGEDLLKRDYFWSDKDRKWYNKCSSLFTEREETIAQHLMNVVDSILDAEYLPSKRRIKGVSFLRLEIDFDCLVEIGRAHV